MKTDVVDDHENYENEEDDDVEEEDCEDGDGVDAQVSRFGHWTNLQ